MGRSLAGLRMPAFRRVLAVAMAVSLVAGVLALIAVPPAAAQVFNIIPTDENGDPTDSFVTGQALWAYITSDFGGGVICVVSADVDSAQGGSCAHPAMGDKVFVGVVLGGWVPVMAPYLEPGSYRLLADNGGPGQDRVSEEFTVSPCSQDQPCPKEWTTEQLTVFKAGMGVLYEGLKPVCQLLDLISKWETVQIASESATMMMSMASEANPVGLAATIQESGTIAVKGFFSAAKKAFFPPDVLKEFLRNKAVCDEDAWAKKIADDPPDPNFTSIAAPHYRPTALDGIDADGIGSSLTHANGNSEALLHALERFQGAQAAGAENYEHAQAGVRSPRTRRVWSTTCSMPRRLSGPSRTPTRTTQPMAERRSRRKRRRMPSWPTANGSATRASMQASSRTWLPPASPRPRSTTSAPSSSTTCPVSLSMVRSSPRLADAATQIDAALPSIGEFGRLMSAISGGTNHAPVASFTHTPASGPGPLPVTFTNTSSSDDLDPITSSWDFGDGATSTDASPTHVYGTPGTYTAVLTVSDGQGATATASAPGRGLVDGEPAARGGVRRHSAVGSGAAAGRVRRLGLERSRWLDRLLRVGLR